MERCEGQATCSGRLSTAVTSAQSAEMQPRRALWTKACQLTTWLAVWGCRLRVAVTTDLAARGVDLERVNLVVNLELPADAATYMHRVGRAGRFGTRGVAVTLLAGEGELAALEEYLHEQGGQVRKVWGCEGHSGAGWVPVLQERGGGQRGLV